MFTYCISDIHGNLRALQALLEEIKFHYDGSDRLYLLGDYVDWGPDAISTLQYVMELSRHPFVTCLIGNHDMMFLNEIVNSDCGRRDERYDKNWLYANRGIGTWQQYLSLSIDEREQIRDWLLQLPFSAEAEINGKWYLLGHAGPYLPEKDIEEGESHIKKMDAVWYRIRSAHENPMEHLYERFSCTVWEHREYVKFVCGHSITYHYISFSEDEPYRIFSGEHFIDIDCGAKCMGLDPARDRIPEEVIRQCRLSALRLEDLKEFYCDRQRAGYEKDGKQEEQC